MDESRHWIEWFLFWVIAALLALLVVSDVVAAPPGETNGRLTQIVSPDAIVKTAERLIRERIGEDPLVEVTPVQHPSAEVVPQGRLFLKAVARGEIASVVPVTVEILVDGTPQRAVFLTLRVDRYQDVVVAARPLRRLLPIAAEDVKIERRLVTGLPAGPLARVEEAVGLLASREIRAGEAFSSKLVQPPALVRRGEIVTLIVEGEGVTITARGQAKEEGQRGQMIRVMNLSSKKELYGRVEGERQVKIPF